MKKRKGSASFLKPLMVISVLLGIFGLVWLRSGVVSLEYSISRLEAQKAELLRDKKLLAAQRANLLSLDRFETASASGFVFPDRVKVVYVKRTEDGGTVRASFRR